MRLSGIRMLPVQCLAVHLLGGFEFCGVSVAAATAGGCLGAAFVRNIRSLQHSRTKRQTESSHLCSARGVQCICCHVMRAAADCSAQTLSALAAPKPGGNTPVNLIC